MADTSVSYKCLNCGGPLEYQAGSTTVTCPYCDTQYDIQKLEETYAKQQEAAAKAQEAKEKKWNTEEAGSEWSVEEAQLMKAFTCSSCGAEIVTDENTIATECCYCGNPTMLPSRFDGNLKPDYILPFEKSKEDAIAAMKEYYKGKVLLPDAFTNENRLQEIQGLYVPFWLFDSGVEAVASFNATTSVAFDNGEALVTETSHYKCNRSGTAQFSMIPVDGSSKMDDNYMDSIEPFDYSKLQPFTTAYMPGYLADKYDEDAEACAPRADARMAASMQKVMEEQVTGYETCTLEDCQVGKTEGKVRYCLAPVWILTTQYEGKPYTFMMNGQTGKFIGSLPIDNGKLQKYQAIAGGIVAVVAYFVLNMIL